MILGKIHEVYWLDVFKFPLQVAHQTILVGIVLLKLDLHGVELVMVVVRRALAWLGLLQVLELLGQSINLGNN